VTQVLKQNCRAAMLMLIDDGNDDDDDDYKAVKLHMHEIVKWCVNLLNRL